MLVTTYDAVQRHNSEDHDEYIQTLLKFCHGEDLNFNVTYFWYSEAVNITLQLRNCNCSLISVFTRRLHDFVTVYIKYILAVVSTQ